MPTRAFLLSPDERALDAITQILSELEVSFELFHDPSTAAKRVGSQHFDLLFVDCDNEQHGSHVFAAAKRSESNQAPIAIAIVDGKKGVVGAFRLGASLVLSKPVSMEQARGTVRNALATLRKAAPETKAAPAVQSTPAIASPVKNDSAAAVSLSARVQPAPKAPSAVTPASTVGNSLSAKLSESVAVSKPMAQAILKPAPEKREFADAGSVFKDTTVKPSKSVSLLGHEPLGSRQPAPPMFGMSEKEKSQRKSSPFLLAAVAMALIAAGVYGYSTLNPGFHNLVLSQFHSLEVLAGLKPKSQSVAVTPKPAPVAPAIAEQETAAKNTSAVASQVPDGFATPETAPPQGFQASPTPQSTTPVILNTSATSQKTEADGEPLVVPQDVSESHLAFRVQPTYPEVARRKGVKGSVVLNASVDKDGNVAAVEVVSGNAQLASAAVAAVKQWRYQAYYHGGQPSEFQTQVTVQFPQPTSR